MGIFTAALSNELPFVLGLPNGTYTVRVSTGNIDLEVYGDYHKLIISPFPSVLQRKAIVYGTAKVLESYIYDNNISHYAFEDCWTYVRSTFTENVSESDYMNLDEHICISHIESDLLRKGRKENFEDEARKLWSEYDETLRTEVKLAAYLNRMVPNFLKHETFYEAVNKLISHCAVYNNRIWLHQVNESILNGLNISCYYNNQQFHSAKFIERAWAEPAMQSAFPSLSQEDLVALKEGLQSDVEIPFETKAYHISMSLWNRGEYRSAIIEMSAALDHVIGKVLRRKMRQSGISDGEIEKTIKQSRSKFSKLCNELLEMCAGKRFCDDKPSLYATILRNREHYRHLIAHSDKSPDKDSTEGVIRDFKCAIEYFSAIV